MERRVTLNAQGQFDLARAAGFDTYDDFVAWKERKPDEYEQWYQQLKQRAKSHPNEPA